MTKKRDTSRVLVGLFLIVLGGLLILLSRPAFSYTMEKLEQVPKSEIIMNNSFTIHQSQDKVVQVQMKIGQTLGILASGDKNFTFLIANYTDPENVTALDEPDVTYYILNGTLTVNTTWSPQTRTAEQSNYYLTFLARNFPAESPVYVYANVTKKWTDIETKTIVAPDLKPLIDPNYMYVGLGVVILGGIILIHIFYRRRRQRSQRR
jgi:hypothetical protein